jgi:hypothetical protein
LARVESACNTIVAQGLEADAVSVSGVDTAAKRVADAESAAEADVQRVRLESDIEVAELRRLVDRLRTDLQSQRERLNGGWESIDGPQAENGSEGDAAAETPELAASYRSQLLGLRDELQASRAECTDLARRLEGEKANHSRLIAAVRCVQQTNPSSSMIGSVVSAGPWVPVGGAILDSAREPLPGTEYEPSANSTDTACTDRLATGSVLAGKAPHPEQEDRALDFDPSQYARELLSEIEAVYDADKVSAMPFDKLVDRIAGNLRHAATIFARRVGFASGPGHDVFDQQLTAMLDEKGGSVFGRHLAIAAHDYDQQDKNLDVKVA